VPLPELIKVEAKFTTGSAVPLPEREREALAVDGPGQVGRVAALFLEDARDEGRWLLVDATAIRERDAASARLGREALRRMGRTQPHLGELRAHLDAGFPRFLQGFLDEALEGHDALVAALGSLHASGALERRLPDWDVLDSEHRGNLRTLVERHGESGAGRILQDLLAYAIASAGYGKVVNNAVGVPDFVVSGLASAERVHLSVSAGEAAELARLCRLGGNEELARLVEGAAMSGAKAVSKTGSDR